MRVRAVSPPAALDGTKKRAPWSAFFMSAGRPGDGRRPARLYFRTAATALATASRLRVFSAATQIRPVPTA